MKKENNKEMLPVVDELGNVLGAATREECHGKEKPLHPVVHLHVFNSKGQAPTLKRYTTTQVECLGRRTCRFM